jgi:hypothetical protein
MKYINILFVVCFTTFNLNAQNISGTYRWKNDDGRKYFEITLSAFNITLGSPVKSYKGEHCGVFENGNRVDCSIDQFTITLDQVAENIFTGSIFSEYSQTISEIKITYIPASGNIKWEVTKHGGGQNYFPMNAILKKD